MTSVEKVLLGIIVFQTVLVLISAGLNIWQSTKINDFEQILQKIREAQLY